MWWKSLHENASQVKRRVSNISMPIFTIEECNIRLALKLCLRCWVVATEFWPLMEKLYCVVYSRLEG